MTGINGVGRALNSALHELFSANKRLFLLGEDIADPYGGAFGVTRGLSSRYPERVISTPISEAAIAGVAGGLAMCGDYVIVEIMFGDFITLCFDALVNFISKSVSMYGRRIPMRVVVRCPVGGNRGYGPTHSQSLQKHLLGVPNLSLYELSQVHDVGHVFDRIFASEKPAVIFEDKVLYTQPVYDSETIDNVFRYVPIDDNWTLVAADDDPPAWLVIAPGGLMPRTLAAMRTALLENDISSHLLVPSRLFPLDTAPVLPICASAGRILVVEDGVAGGGWATEVSERLYRQLWARLQGPIRILQPPCEVIPAAAHLERRLLIQDSTIYRVLIGEANG